MPNNEYANEPNQSRSEDIIQSILDNTEYDEEARSRIEYLLIELKNAIEGGGGGGGVTSYAPLTEKPKIDDHTLQAGNNTSSDLGLQTKLAFDSAPTENSTNPVTSDGVYTALDSKANSSDVYNKSTVDDALTAKADKSTTYTKSEIDTSLGSKQNTISDLPTIRSGAALGATAVQPISGKGLSTNDYTDVEKTKLAGVAEGAEVNEIESIKVNNTTIDPDANKVVNITVPTTAADVSALPDTTKYAVALSLTINSSTFVMTGQLKDQNGDNLGTAQTIDLPLESVVVGGSYNSQTKKVVLTLQNGNTIEFSVADLISGLQTELSTSNKLNPAFIEYDSTHRAVSDTEKSAWNSKQNALSSAQLDAVNSGIDSTKVEQIETNKNNISYNTNNGVKNRFDFDTWSQNVTVKSGTKTVSGNSITITATANDCFTAWRANEYPVNARIPVSAGETVVFTWNTNAVQSKGQVFLFSEGDATDYVSVDATAKIITHTIPSGVTFITIRFSVVTSGDIITYSDIMVRSSLVQDSTYQPYAMSNAELTAKEQANENNILTANAELIELVDSGAKNKIFVDKLNAKNANGVTYTINSDGTITVNGTPSGTSPSYVVVALSGGGTYKNFAEYCNGDNVLSGCPSGGGNGIYRMYITGTGYAKEDFGNGVELTDTSVTPVYLIIYIYNGYTADNLTFKPMICSKSAWDISHVYQPYRPSYQELYERVVALEQANQ